MDNGNNSSDHKQMAEERKSDHINLAFEAQQKRLKIDNRFYYEPLLSPHLSSTEILKTQFLGFDFELPMWVSSMTGGTKKAAIINKNLARACHKYGMGMGLGSCRYLLDSDEHLPDFQVKSIMPNMPLYANLGIAQLETLAENKEWNKITSLIDKLDADGLIIHVNPLQEWTQPEGDRFKKSPLNTIQQCIDHLNTSLIVKEVGQGIGPKSLEALLQLPIDGIELAGSGGTNFSLLELLRSNPMLQKELDEITHIGHTTIEMIQFLNDFKVNQSYPAKDIIISGGVNGFLDNYYLRHKLDYNSVTGHASSLLRYAIEGYDLLDEYLELQREGLLVAHSYLTVK